MAYPENRRRVRQGRNQQHWNSPTDNTTPEYSRDPNELGEGFERRGWRPGSDYYGNDPERYIAHDYNYGAGLGDQRGRGPKGYRRSDERIREDVCEFLTADDQIDASDIDVGVKDCEVTLSGTVTSREQRRRAADLIEGISGVREVNNSLRIAAHPRW